MDFARKTVPGRALVSVMDEGEELGRGVASFKLKKLPRLERYTTLSVRSPGDLTIIPHTFSNPV